MKQFKLSAKHLPTTTETDLFNGFFSDLLEKSTDPKKFKKDISNSNIPQPIKDALLEYYLNKENYTTIYNFLVAISDDDYSIKYKGKLDFHKDYSISSPYIRYGGAVMMRLTDNHDFIAHSDDNFKMLNADTIREDLFMGKSIMNISIDGKMIDIKDEEAAKELVTSIMQEYLSFSQERLENDKFLAPFIRKYNKVHFLMRCEEHLNLFLRAQP